AGRPLALARARARGIPTRPRDADRHDVRRRLARDRRARRGGVRRPRGRVPCAGRGGPLLPAGRALERPRAGPRRCAARRGDPARDPGYRRMIEIACQTYSLRSRSGPDMLESVRKAGFRAVELWVGHADYRADPGSAARMRRAAERTGVALQSYCVGGFVREGVATVADRLARAFAYAAELGVSLVTGVVDRRAIPVVDALCRRTGLRFAVENHWYADIARGDDWRRALVDASPLVGATLDTGHAVAAGEDPCAVLAALGERVLDVHLKDVVVSTRLQRLLWRRPRMEGRSIGGGDVPIA